MKRRVNFLSKNNMAVGIIISILILILGVPVGINQWKAVYNESIGYKRNLLNNVERMKAGFNFSYYKNLFGEPVMSKSFSSGDVNLREDTFINKYFYITTFTNSDQVVIFYALTTRTRAFAPVLTIPSMQVNKKDTVVTLGKTEFSSLAFTDQIIPHVTYNKDVGEDDINWAGNYVYFCGAHDWSYYERYYFGNPSNYQTLYFGLNEAGYDQSFVNVNDINDSDAIIKASRDFVINTYAESAPGWDKLKFPNQYNLGVNYDDVRIFN